MDPNRWPPYSQQPYSHLSSGSPHLPHTATHEEPLNNYGNGNSVLFSSSQSIQTHSSSTRSYNSANHAPPMLPNSHFEPLASPSPHPSNKEASSYYNDNMFNGVSKEGQSRMHNFPRTRNEENGFSNSENSSRLMHHVPSSSYHPNTDQPSLGPFGELPHQTIKHRVNRFDPNNESFYPPVSKPAGSGSYNNGPYTDREVNVYSSAPLSVQSAYSGDTSSLSPALNSLNSPSEYYSSPQNNFGAYNSLQSPAPNSPSVTQHSYPSSPYANVDPNIALPPCSPMNGGNFPVPRRNIQNHQPSPSSSSAMCYNPPSQSMAHHGPQSVIPKSEYHSEYSGYTNERNSYSSLYPSSHHGQMFNVSNSKMSPRSHSLPQDRRVRYGQPYGPSAAASSPHYLQNNSNSHEIPYGSYSSNVSSVQPVQPSRYRTSSTLNSYRTYSHHPTLVPVVSNQFENYNSYGCPSSNLAENNKSLDMYNSRMESSTNNQDQESSYSNYNVQVLDSDVLLTRQTRQPKADECPLKQPMKLESANMTVNHRQTIPSEYTEHYSYEQVSSTSTFHTPRRRGRRARGRRGGRVHFGQRRYVGRGRRPRILENYEYIDSYPSHLYLHSENPSPMKMEYKQEIIDMEEEYYEPPCQRTIFEDRIGRQLSIEEELNFLLKLTFNLHATRRTRSTCRKETGFQRRFIDFVRRNSCDNYLSNPNSSELNVKEGRKERDRIYLKISRLGRDKGWWECKEISTGESASDNFGNAVSSHQIKRVYDSKEKSKHAGKLSKVSETYTKHSAKRKNDYIDYNICHEKGEKNNDFTNYQTLPAGDLKVNIENESALQNEEPIPKIPKKRGRKAKVPPPENLESNEITDVPVEIVKISDSSPSVTKNEAAEEEKSQFDDFDPNSETGRPFSLRRRKGENQQAEPEPGPSQQAEEAEFSDGFDDNFDFNLDDSDSDPTWTGKSSKVSDVPPTSIKKRGQRSGTKRLSSKNSPRPTSSSPPPPKRKKYSDNKDDGRIVPSITIVRAKPTVKKEKPKEPVKKEAPKKEKKKKEGNSSKKSKKFNEPEATDRFLIAKADLDQPTPYIWKVDKRTHMLQRFEVAEQNGVLIYQSSFTYAAWNEFSFHQYVSAKVEFISRSPTLHVVKFLGPDPSEPVENAFFANSTPVITVDSSSKDSPSLTEEDSTDKEVKPDEDFDHLKENFDIYLQSLISQAVDSSFLSEIKRENDEYFLNNINAIDSVTDAKKEKLKKNFWDEELNKSAHTFPNVNILDSVMEQDECQVCKKKKGFKLLQFYGQPYDTTTLSSLVTSPKSRTQYFVCSECATTVSLYNRLHHQKYNFFVKCRTKLNEVREERETLESHTLLGDCLEDHIWVNSLFDELVHDWHESERNS